jgi:aspartate/methionine/tyrosine aminotransferase
MPIPPIDLFTWLLSNCKKADYLFCFSNIHGLSFEEYQQLTNFTPPQNFDLGWNEHQGAEELKQILATLYHCGFSNIVTTCGGSEANLLVFISLLNKGDAYIIEQPGYPPMWLTPQIPGAHQITWPRTYESHFKLDVTALHERITKKTKLIILTNLHNPSGVLTDRTTLRALSDIASDYHLHVLIDEIFLDGSFTPAPSAYGLPHITITSSVTKIYGLGGLRTGWIIAPQDIARLCQQTKAHTCAAAPYLSEIMTAHALAQARTQLIQRFQDRATTNFTILKNWMKDHPHLLKWVEPQGGIMCFPRYMIDIPSLKLCTYLLNTYKLLVNPGFYFNEEGHIRLSYGCDTPSFKAGLVALEEGLEHLQKQTL